MENTDPSLTLIHLFLPDEIIYIILSRLPVKSLLRFKLVCKSWLSIISDPNFIKTHLYISATDPDYKHHRLVLAKKPYVPQFSPQYYKLSTCSLSFLLKEPEPLTRSMRHKPVIDHTGGKVRVVGSCNGLICLRDVEDGNVVFWNPSTRKSRKLPKLEIKYDPEEDCFPYVYYGFWYDEFTDDFKLLALFGSEEKYEVSTYSSISDSWTMIGDFPFKIVYASDGKFANGAIYWEVTEIHHSLIITFDIKSETFRKLMLPEPNHEQGYSFWRFDIVNNSPSIVYIYDDHADFWIIKDGGLEKPWTKLFTMSYDTRPQYLRPPIFIFPSGYSEYGDIMLSYDDTVNLYNSEDNTFVDVLDFSVEGLLVHSYVESLISP